MPLPLGVISTARLKELAPQPTIHRDSNEQLARLAQRTARTRCGNWSVARGA